MSNDVQTIQLLQHIADNLDQHHDYSLITSAITVAGMLCAAWLAAFFQLRNTRAIIDGEREKMLAQMSVEAAQKDNEKRRDTIRTNVAELLAIVDPDANSAIDHKRVTTLIHGIQVLCDPEQPVHCTLCGATTQLGLALQGRGDRVHILSCQDQMVEACRRI